MELDIIVVLVPLLPHQALSIYLHTYYCGVFKEYTLNIRNNSFGS